MSTTVANFVKRYLPDAEAVSASTGLSPDFILGVAGEESGWGQHYVGNNLFGIGGSNSATYASPDASFTAFGSLITGDPRYAAVVNAGGDPQAEATALGTTAYNPAGPAYGAQVAQTTQMVSNQTGGLAGNLVPGVAGAATPGASPTVGNQALAGGVTSGSWWGEVATRSALVALGLAFIMGGVYLMGRRVSL